MKRSLVAATAVALLVTGCATGETGHLDPGIDPDLTRPAPSGERFAGPEASDESEGAEQLGGDADDAEEGDGEGQAGEESDEAGAGAAGGDADEAEITAEVESAFNEGTAGEDWAGEVTTVYRAPGTITLTTLFTEVGPEALAACEAGADAARSAGISEPRVEVLTEEGQVLAGIDVAAGEEACA